MGGKAMAQGVHGHALVDSSGLGGCVDRPVELAGAERFDGIEPGKEPAAVEHLALGSGDSPPNPQALEQDRRKHGISILLTFTLAQRAASCAGCRCHQPLTPPLRWLVILCRRLLRALSDASGFPPPQSVGPLRRG